MEWKNLMIIVPGVWAFLVVAVVAVVVLGLGVVEEEA